MFAVLCQASGALAQQPTAPAAQIQGQTMTPTAADVVREFGSSASTVAKSVTVGLRELSPWSMFVSASLIVQAIMAGLAFASFVTWTIFVAKFIELFIAKRRLGAAVSAIAGARTLSEASPKLSSDRSVVRPFVVAAIEEIRLSPGLDSDVGIKERVASSFSEITKSEARRVRFGMGISGNDRRHSSVCRVVWHRLGHHEQLYWDFQIADNKPRRGRARDRRGAPCDCNRFIRGHPRSDHLQSLFPRDQRISGPCRTSRWHGCSSAFA